MKYPLLLHQDLLSPLIKGEVKHPGSETLVEPEEILDWYDGPLLYTAVHVLHEAGSERRLWYSMSDAEGVELWLVAPITPEQLQRLKDGQDSLRTAITREPLWLAQVVRQENECIIEWICELYEIDPNLPNGLLPYPDVTLYPRE